MGQLWANVGPDLCDYLLPGEGLEYTLYHHTEASDAAARATGLAALVLWCFKMRPPPSGDLGVNSPEHMHRVFQYLQSRTNDQRREKWVDVTKLLGAEEANEIDKVVEMCISAVNDAK